MIAKTFEELVQKNPDHIALKSGDMSMTYRELNRYANRVARLILETLDEGGAPARVSLLLEHGPDMIAAILGVLKAGKVYVPLSTDYPDNRLAYMVENSESALILAFSRHRERAEELARPGQVECVFIDRDSEDFAEKDKKPAVEVPGDHLAYIMYTSGSTGRPKGVMQTHENVLYYIRNWTRIFSITAADRMTLFSSFCHDGSVQDMLGALLNGATLYPVNVRGGQETFKLSDFLNREKITIWHSVHSLFAYFANSLDPGEHFPSLNRVLLGGEPIRGHEIDLFKKFFPRAVLANVYGQTESSVNSIWLIHPQDTIDYLIIGEPLDNTEIIILDEDDLEVDEYEIGEIIVACPHVSPGYWKDEKSTKKAFARDEESRLLYFTGDLGRLLPGPPAGGPSNAAVGGRIEFMGRRDSQVKIRGYRVELGEIESQLLKHPQVHEAVVATKELDLPGNTGPDGGSPDTYLCAYIVSRQDTRPVGDAYMRPEPEPGTVEIPSPDSMGAAPRMAEGRGGADPNPGELRTFLSQVLPDYMIPTYFTFLDRLPLTQSGKIDRRALPEPELGAGARYEAPRNPVEKKLVDIWHAVLGVEKEKIGIDADFFELGGHSLKGTTMISKVHVELNVQLPVAAIFEIPTIRGVAEYIKKADREIYIPIEPAVEQEYYPVSSMQKRLFILSRIGDIDTAYNMRSIIQVEGKLDIPRLERAFAALIERHESLRTSFELRNDQPVQVIHEPGDIEFNIEFGEPCVPLSLRPNPSEQATDSIIDRFIRPFDLKKAPLIRVGLIALGVDNHILMIDVHHIVFDGTSLTILLREFAALYSGKELAPVPLQYKDYSEWLNGEEKKAAIQAQEAYWLEQFTGEIPILELPYDYSRPAEQSFAGNSSAFGLSAGETGLLRELCVKENVTMYMVLLSALNLLLAKLSGREDVVVGTGTAGRNYVEVRETVGIFVNTLAMRNYPRAEKRFSDFLYEVKERTLQAFANQEYRFEGLIDRLAVTRDAGRNPLFDVMFVLQNMEFTAFEVPGLRIKPYKYERRAAIFDMNVQAYEYEGELRCHIGYCTKLFKAETIDRFLRYFKTILLSLPRNIDETISGIEILSPEERRRLVIEFNDTETPFPKDKTIGLLFEEQVERTPDRAALTGSCMLTYNRLDEEAGMLAELLVRKGAGPDTPVGIITGRSPQMITGIFGILKSGGAYLPISPGSPVERIDYMLADSGAKIVLISRDVFNRGKIVSNRQVETLILEDVRHALLAPVHDSPVNDGQPQGLPLQSSTAGSPGDLAYIIYTSGTTGKPKGTLTGHSNVIRVVRDTNYIEITENDRILQLSNYAFDGSVFDIYGALLNGAALALVNEEDASVVDRLAGFIVRESITVFFVTTALFNTLVENRLDCFERVRKVLFGGERISVGHSAKALDFLGKGRVVHVYGPTETTVYASYYFIDRVDEAEATIPIGRPISNTTMYIMDRSLKPVPIGVAGEIYIGGDGTARGYLNNPELTHEKFLRSFFQKATPRRDPHENQSPVPLKGARSACYKTGDLARWLPDGNIEFIGRTDHQVKLRGFRIEPGEIEKRLLEHEAVKEAVVIDRDGSEGEKYLCAYIILNNAEPAGTLRGCTRRVPAELREFVSRTLPDYMIPSYFLQVERIPLTSNGKLDKKSLPLPDIHSGRTYVAPRDLEEKKLAALWAEVLHVDSASIGSGDNFFELGGHSLKGAILAAKVQRELNVRITLAQIFRFPTIRKLAGYLSEAAGGEYADIEPVEEKSVYPLSFNQKRVWFIQQRDPESPAFNMSDIIELEHEVDRDALKKALVELIRRHGSLRTCFKIFDDEPVQAVRSRLEEIPYRETDISNCPETRVDEEWQRVFEEDNRRLFDLNRPPLCRFLLVKVGEEDYRLIFTKHHIISDGWSMRIFKSDFDYFYSCFAAGETPQPPVLRLRYTDFSWWNNRFVADSALSGEAYRFWKEKLAGDFPVLALPRPIDGDSRNVSGAMYRFLIPGPLSEKLKRLGESYNTTLFVVMFSTYLIALSRYANQKEMACSIISAGREQESLLPVIGFFVNSILFKTLLNKDETFARFLSRVHKEFLQCMNHQNYPLEPVFEELKKRYPDVPAAFNLVNIPAAAGTDGHSRGNKAPAAANPGSMEIESYEPHHMDGFRDVKFDLEPYITEYKNGIDTIWAYKKSLFDAFVIESFVQDYVKLLDFFCDHPQKSYTDFRAARKKRKFGLAGMSRPAAS